MSKDKNPEDDNAPQKTPSQRTLHLVEQYGKARDARFYQEQTLGFCAREFIICGLPYRRPKTLKYERRNGNFVLKITGDPDHGVPYGQDRLLPIWLASAFQLLGCPEHNTIRFRSASDIVRAFQTESARKRPPSGTEITRWRQRIQRVFGATYFARDESRGQSWLSADSYRLIDRICLWFDQKNVIDKRAYWQNTIQLSTRFANDLRKGAIPIDLDTIRGLKESPAALDLYIWQAWRSFRLAKEGKSLQKIPVFGPEGLWKQLGTETGDLYKAKQQMRAWQDQVRFWWQTCPNELSEDGSYLLVRPQLALQPHARISLPGVSKYPPIPYMPPDAPPDVEIVADDPKDPTRREARLLTFRSPVENPVENPQEPDEQ